MRFDYQQSNNEDLHQLLTEALLEARGLGLSAGNLSLLEWYCGIKLTKEKRNADAKSNARE